MKRREDRRLLLGAGRFVDDLRPLGALSVIFVRSPARPRAHHAARRRGGPPRARRGGGGHRRRGAPPRAHAREPRDSRHEGAAASDHRRRRRARGRRAGGGDRRGERRSRRGTRPRGWSSSTTSCPRRRRRRPRWPRTPRVLFTEVEGNRSFRRALNAGDPDAAFARAAHRVPLRIAQERISAVAMEPRTVVASFDAAAQELTLWVSCQAPFRIRGEVARLLELSESAGARDRARRGRRLRREDRPLSRGGAAGVAGGAPRAAAALGRRPGARTSRRPTTRAARSARASWRSTPTAASSGCAPASSRRWAPRCMNAAAGSPWNHARLLPGAYVIPSCDIVVEGALTNTAPVAAYRGAGRPEACFAIERLMDTAARALEARSGRAAPAQPDPGRPLPVQDHHRPDLRLRQLSRGARRGRWPPPTTRRSGARRRRGGRAARSSASASPATSSPARSAGRAAASRSSAPGA